MELLEAAKQRACKRNLAIPNPLSQKELSVALDDKSMLLELDSPNVFVDRQMRSVSDMCYGFISFNQLM